MASFIKGYICRSKNSDSICIGKPDKDFKKPEIEKDTGRYCHIPGWFHTMSVRAFKKAFGFSIKPGTHEQINISISKTKLQKQLESLEKELK